MAPWAPGRGGLQGWGGSEKRRPLAAKGLRTDWEKENNSGQTHRKRRGLGEYFMENQRKRQLSELGTFS